MTAKTEGQIVASAAEIYETFFVPALFSEWTDRILGRCRLQEGDSFLDVACGTGILAREAKARVGDTGRSVGLDANDGMLKVAASIAPDMTWCRGLAEELPFKDREFSSVASQFGIMFFNDGARALAEMKRVTAEQGKIVVAAWDTIDKSPGYTKMLCLIEKLFGQDIANELRAPFKLGDDAKFEALLRKGGLQHAEIENVVGRARFPSISSWVKTEIKGWTLADQLSDEEFARLDEAADKELREFVQPDGTVQFEISARLATAAV